MMELLQNRSGRVRTTPTLNKHPGTHAKADLQNNITNVY